MNIVHKGANYGYSQREGNQTLQRDNQIEVAAGRRQHSGADQRHRRPTARSTPTYPGDPVPPRAGGGDAIGSGFVYRGKRIPALRGKFVFSDITTGRIWYADYKEMLAADDGDPRRWRRCTR